MADKNRDFIVIGFAAGMRCGKDTAMMAAKVALMKKNYQVEHMKFASVLKDMLYTMTGQDMDAPGLDREAIDPISGRSYRYLMQTLGTEWGRELVSDNLWVDVLANRIEEARQKHITFGNRIAILISDVRFPNELKMLDEQASFIVHLTRPGFGADIKRSAWRKALIKMRLAKIHQSEQVLPVREGDLIARNNSTLEAFEETIEATVNRIILSHAT